MLTFVSLVTIVPSIYFGYALVQRERFTENANKLIADISVIEGSYLLKNEINARTKKITLVYGGSKLSDKSKKEILHLANFASLGNAKIEFQQGFALNENKDNISQADKLKSEVNRLNVVLAERQKKSDSILSKPIIGKQLLREINALFPEVKSCSYAETLSFQDSTKVPVKIVIIESGKKQISPDSKRKINTWLKKRLQSEKVKTYFD